MTSEGSAAAMMIRPVRAGDRDAWLVLWSGYQSFYGVRIPTETTSFNWQRLLDPAEPMHAALAIDAAGAPVGLVHLVRHRSTWTVADYCYLQDLYVAAEARGAGVGGALLDYAYAWAEQHGCARVHWLTHESNATAQSLYRRSAERSGFIQYRKVLAARG